MTGRVPAAAPGAAGPAPGAAVEVRGLSLCCGPVRAIAVEPDVVLLDEPASALDPVSTPAIEALMLELTARHAIVVATHDMQQAARAGDRTAFLTVAGAGEPGRLVEHDRTERILSAPSQPATEACVSGRFG